MRLLPWILAASAMAPAFAAESLKCPAGTKVMRDAELRQEKRNEWCEDIKTRKPDGPARIVNAKETVLVNIVFEQGETVSHRFTRAGLERLLSEVNGNYASQGIPASFMLIDEQTLRFNMSFKGGLPGGQMAEFRKQVLAMPMVCRMLSPAETEFRAMNIVVTNEKKAQIGTTTVTRAECEKASGQ